MSEKVKVSELNATTTNNDDDLIMVVQENENNELENFKITRENFLAGVYEVPSGGIPKTDLASAVQTSLGKADSAVQNTDYATGSTGGVVKVTSDFGIYIDNGIIKGSTKTYESYTSGSNNLIISKATLENVLNARIGDINDLLDTINGEVI